MSKKWLFISAVASSNVLILGLVLNVYFSNTYHTSKLYSSSDALASNVKKNCEKEIEKVLNNSKESHTCKLTRERESYQRTSQARKISYYLETEIQIKKTEDNKIEIISNGKIKKIEGLRRRLKDGRRSITEATSCTDCLEATKQVGVNSEIKNIMEQIVVVAGETKKNALTHLERVLAETQEKTNLNDRHKKIARYKEARCLGEWNNNKGKFVPFITQYEKINCKLERLAVMDFNHKDTFYHEKLKKELWEQILNTEDNDELSESLKGIIRDPYRYSLSVRSSANIIDNFIHWKYLFEEDSNVAGFKSDAIKQMQLEASVFTSLMTESQKKTDVDYFKRGLVQLSSGGLQPDLPSEAQDLQPAPAPNTPNATNPINRTIPLKPLPSWNDVKELYK